jgi:hypothetical protein
MFLNSAGNNFVSIARAHLITLLLAGVATFCVAASGVGPVGQACLRDLSNF